VFLNQFDLENENQLLPLQDLLRLFQCVALPYREVNSIILAQLFVVNTPVLIHGDLSTN